MLALDRKYDTEFLRLRLRLTSIIVGVAICVRYPHLERDLGILPEATNQGIQQPFNVRHKVRDTNQKHMPVFIFGRCASTYLVVLEYKH